MDCQTTDEWNSVDLCDVPECVAAKIERDDLARPHLPTHDLVKVRRVVHMPQVGQLEQTTRSALERARQLIGLGSDKIYVITTLISFPRL
jgi:hypothetical protein